MHEFTETKRIIKIEGFQINSDPVEAVKRDLEKYTDLSHLSTGKNNVEVTNITAQKGLALKKYMKNAGLSEDEIMVLGDSDNDISMF